MSTAATSMSSSSSSRGGFLSPAAPVFQPSSSVQISDGQGDVADHLLLMTSSSGSPHIAAAGAPPSRLSLNPNAVPFHTSHLQTSLGIPMAYSPASMSHSPVSPMSSGTHSPFSISPGATTPSYISNGLGASSQNNLAQAARWASAVSQQQHLASTGVNMERRGSRGGTVPPINQPFKMMHHNSKPSVSLNPAALSSLLAAAKPKRRTIIRLPDLSDCARGESTVSEEAEQVGEAADPAQERRRKLRLEWATEWPSEDEEANQVFASPRVPMESIRSCDTFTDPDAPLEGLPDYIDICLPTRDGWEELKACFLRERLEYEETGSETLSSQGSSADGTARVTDDDRGQHLHTQRSISHAPVMSLSMPSSGQPFGPSALSALGLHRMNRSQSDRGGRESTAALEKRPSLERVHTDVPTASRNENVRQLASADAWRDLGHGFGYDVTEAEGNGKGVEQKNSGSGNTGRDSTGEVSAGQGSRGEVMDGDWRAQRRRVSGTGSDDEGDDDEEKRRRGQREGRDKEEDENSEDTETGSTSEEEEYSNPSDEEEARQARAQRRGRRKAEREVEPDETLAVEDAVQTRRRSGTANTFASSSIAPEETDLPRRYSLLARGPLDDYAPALTRSTSLRGSQMHPSAPPFAPRGLNHSHFSSTPASTFSSDTVRRRGSSLNAAAPTFTPGSFTFTAPQQAPRLPSLPYDPVLEDGRDLQGREKRQRQRDDAVVDGQRSLANPPGATATVESSLWRDAAVPPVQASVSNEERGRRIFEVAGDHNGSSTPSVTEEETENDETVKEDRSMDGTLLNRFDPPRRSSLAATMLYSERSSSANLKREMSLLSQQRRRSSGIELNKYGDSRQAEGDGSDSGSVSDIIEELVERMDEALEGWAGRILDEMMIIGQVRPVTMGVLDQQEKQSIAEVVKEEIKGLLVEQMERLSTRDTRESFGQVVSEDTPGRDAQSATVMSGVTPDLAAIKELISGLHRDHTEAMEVALVQMKQTSSRGVEKGGNDVEAIAKSVYQHLQSMQEDSVHLEKAKLIDILDPMLEEYQNRSQAKAQVERKEVIHLLDETLDRRLAEWQKGLREIKQSLGPDTDRKGANNLSAEEADESARLRKRLEEAEKEVRSMRDQMEGLRRVEEEARQSGHAANKKLVEAEANAREKDLLLKSSHEQSQLLRSHIDQMAAEVSSSKEGWEREREKSAQAIAEALDLRKIAEAHLSQERQKLHDARESVHRVEREARERVETYTERASKAEGQVSSLEKRIIEQDSKIASLQQLTATQKQKAAQAGQKLTEMEKRVKELNSKDRELTIAHTRLAEIESRLQDQKELEQRWRATQESESRLREEVAMHRSRFLDLERDVLQMRESLVERSSLEHAQAELSSSREEVALLRKQLAEAQRKEESMRLMQVAPTTPALRRPLKVKRASRGTRDELSWDDSNQTKDRSNTNQPITHGSHTWASMHGPGSSVDDDSYEAVDHAGSRSVSHMSSSRIVEVNDDGWWE